MMSKNKETEILKKVITGFQDNKGRASFYCFNQDLINNIIVEVITNFRHKRENDQILIVIDNYNTRHIVMDYLISKDVNYNITYISENYINLNYNYIYTLIITIGINQDIIKLHKLFNDGKFMISILTKNIMDNEFITNLRNFLPDINLGIQNIVKDNTRTPVEEIQYGVDMNDIDTEKYNKYTEFINSSITMFGDIDTINKCRVGDSDSGISAAEFRDNLARENGWSEELDTSISYQKDIDDIYNPNSLYERAQQFYNITRQRRELVSDNEAKLDIILNICKSNTDKKILIISKRAEFAATITKYLNNNDIKCGDYHDCIENAIATDEYGEVILVKSGSKKGTPRIIGAQAISSSNMKRFNNGYINVLSIKNNSSDKLKIACDLAIITTPLCDDIITLKNRFTNVIFNEIPNKTYKIYTNGTIENNKIYHANSIIKVINETNNVNYDEVSGDVVI